MANTQRASIEGYPEELLDLFQRLPNRKRYRLIEIEEQTSTSPELDKPAAQRVSAMGKYAGVLSSEDFMRRKHEETILEDRPLR